MPSVANSFFSSLMNARKVSSGRRRPSTRKPAVRRRRVTHKRMSATILPAGFAARRRRRVSNTVHRRRSVPARDASGRFLPRRR